MYAKNVFKKLTRKTLNKRKFIRVERFSTPDGKMPTVKIGLRPSQNNKRVIGLDCLVDTGCGFLLSIPMSMSEKFGDFERLKEYDGVGIMPDGDEVSQLAFKANILIAGSEFECICHFAKGIDKPLLGMPLFLNHLKLQISKDGIIITPYLQS